jgi:uncharacterized protein (DUF1501 family)
MDRRKFLSSTLKGCSLLGSYGLLEGIVTKNALANGAIKRNKTKTLVVCDLPGGIDGHNLVVPYGDSAYYDIRPTLAVKENNLVDLNGFFGLNKRAESLKKVYDNGDLAIFPATHNDNFTRSHFEAQDHMLSGFNKIDYTGWANNALFNNPNLNTMRGISLSYNINKLFIGKQGIANFNSLSGFNTGLYKPHEDKIAEIFQNYKLEDKPYSDQVKNFGNTFFENATTLKTLADLGEAVPQNGAKYEPYKDFQTKLKDAAKLIRYVAPEIIYVRFPDGFDSHVNQPAFEPKMDILAKNLRAFYDDLGNLMNDVAVLVCTEFGRTARQNNNSGTDHGHAATWMVMSKNVKGGIYGEWPGMSESALKVRGNAVDHSVENRDIVHELLSVHMGYKNLNRFWEFTGNRLNMVKG